MIINPDYHLSILILPFLSFIILFFFGRFIGKSGAIIFSVLMIFLSLIITLDLFLLTYITNNIFYYQLGTWVDSIGVLVINWDFHFDILTLSMLLTVLLVSLLVHLYS